MLPERKPKYDSPYPNFRSRPSATCLRDSTARVPHDALPRRQAVSRLDGLECVSNSFSVRERTVTSLAYDYSRDLQFPRAVGRICREPCGSHELSPLGLAGGNMRNVRA